MEFREPFKPGEVVVPRLRHVLTRFNKFVVLRDDGDEEVKVTDCHGDTHYVPAAAFRRTRVAGALKFMRRLNHHEVRAAVSTVGVFVLCALLLLGFFWSIADVDAGVWDRRPPAIEFADPGPSPKFAATHTFYDPSPGQSGVCPACLATGSH